MPAASAGTHTTTPVPSARRAVTRKAAAPWRTGHRSWFRSAHRRRGGWWARRATPRRSHGWRPRASRRSRTVARRTAEVVAGQGWRGRQGAERGVTAEALPMRRSNGRSAGGIEVVAAGRLGQRQRVQLQHPWPAKTVHRHLAAGWSLPHRTSVPSRPSEPRPPPRTEIHRRPTGSPPM